LEFPIERTQTLDKIVEPIGILDIGLVKMKPAGTGQLVETPALKNGIIEVAEVIHTVDGMTLSQ